VEVLTGILAGAAFGPNIIGLFSTEAKSDLGQFHLVLDPAAVDEPGAFEARLEQLIDQLAAAPLIPDAPGPVLYPGQPEAERAERCEREGIVVDREHFENLARLAERFDVGLPGSLVLP
jgi:LDH2 family malate/lactate/ureidoglycolate dehydrogenase